MVKPFYSDDLARLYCADVLDWSLWYKGEIAAGRAQPFHAIVTDPPYGLSEPPPIEDVLTAWLAGERFDYGKSGFMGKSWDSLPPGPQIWRALYDITYPGGYLFAFNGTRTADLLSIACRLGGWEPFDRIASFAWVQAQGMAKGVNISKALDASEVVPCSDCDGDGCETCDGSGEVVGAEREVVGVKPTGPLGGKKDGSPTGVGTFRDDNWQSASVNYETAPATPLAQAFDGYNTQLAPKHEPVLLFRRPRDGRTFAQCAREFGSGGLNIQNCRVSCNDKATFPAGVVSETERVFGSGKGMHDNRPRGADNNPSGRWPPNCHFSHVPPTLCPTCHGAGCDACHGEVVVGGCRRVGSKRVRGTRERTETTGDSVISKTGGFGIEGGRPTGFTTPGYADPDGRETVADWECVEGCAVRALDEMAGESKSRDGGKSGTSFSAGTPGQPRTDERKGHNDSGGPSRFYPCHDWSLEIAERLAGETPYAYVPKASRGERDAGLGELPDVTLPEYDMLSGSTEFRHDKRHPDGGYAVEAKPRKNFHPTVKSLSLCKWLATLCLPPAQFKPRICIPFAGSGSEAIGAVLAGWTEIHAIEREQEYCEIAAARIAWWSKWTALTGKTDPDEVRKLGEAAEAKEAWRGDERQRSMWELLE